VLKGEEGDDELFGGGGRDVLDGGEGTNSISGGLGIDLCRNPIPPLGSDCER